MSCVHRSTADGSAHAANGEYDLTRSTVNGRPVYAQRDSDLRLWWVQERGKAPPRRKGEMVAEDSPAWIVGFKESVGTDRGCMFIKSSAWRPEQVVGKGEDNWRVAHSGTYKHWSGREEVRWHWEKQRHFQIDIAVTAHEDDDSDAVRWMDYKDGLARGEDREAVEKILLLWWTTQLNVPRLREALREVPGTLQLNNYRKAASVNHFCCRLDAALSQGAASGHGGVEGAEEKTGYVCTVPAASMASIVSALADVLDAEQLLALVRYGRTLMQSANFREEEVIAGRIYTG